MRLLAFALTLLAPLVANAASLSITQLNRTNAAPMTALLPIDTPYPGRATNDTFGISLEDLLGGTIPITQINVTNITGINEYIQQIVASNVVAGNFQGTIGTISKFGPDAFSLMDSIMAQVGTNLITVNAGSDQSGFIALNRGTSNDPTIEWGGPTNILHSGSLGILVYSNAAPVLQIGEGGDSVQIGPNFVGGSSTLQVDAGVYGFTITPSSKAIIPLTSGVGETLGYNTNYFGGLWLGTNGLYGVYSDDGTQLLRDGVPIGGGGGTNYWTFDGTTLSNTVIATNLTFITAQTNGNFAVWQNLGTNVATLQFGGDNNFFEVGDQSLGSFVGLNQFWNEGGVIVRGADGANFAQWQISAISGGLNSLNFSDQDDTWVTIAPSTGDGGTPYVFDSPVIHTTGNIAEFGNDGTNKIQFSWDGAITTADPTGGLAAPWKMGTNGSLPHIDIAGTGYDLTTGGGTNRWSFDGTTLSNNVAANIDLVGTGAGETVTLYGLTGANWNGLQLNAGGGVTSIKGKHAGSAAAMPLGVYSDSTTDLTLGIGNTGKWIVNATSGDFTPSLDAITGLGSSTKAAKYLYALQVVATNHLASAFPLLVQGQANQSVDLTQWSTGGVNVASMSSVGLLTATGVVLTNSSTATVPLAIDAQAGQTADLLDLNVGGVGKASIDKDGYILAKGIRQIGTAGNRPQINFDSNPFLSFVDSNGDNAVCLRGTGLFQVNSTTAIGFASTTDAVGATADLKLYRDAANTLAQRNGTSAQAFNIYNTYTDASNYERASAQWGGNTFTLTTENAGTGVRRAMALSGLNLQLYSGSSATLRWQIDSSGNFIAQADNTYDIGASGANRPRDIYGARNATFGGALIGSSITLSGLGNSLVFQSRGNITPQSDGVLTIWNIGATDFNRLQFGGTTASFPALKRNGPALNVRLADDSADGVLTYLEQINTGGSVTLSTTNRFYLCNVDAQTITLPTAVGSAGKVYSIKTITPANTATVATTSSQLIDGASTYSLSASNKFVRVISDGANWWNFGSN